MVPDTSYHPTPEEQHLLDALEQVAIDAENTAAGNNSADASASSCNAKNTATDDVTEGAPASPSNAESTSADATSMDGASAEAPASPIDVLAPWGDDGPPPVGRWRADILGDAYESRTLPLADDDEGPVVATAIRYLPYRDPDVPDTARAFPSFAVLYLHGRNDYFFQTELAQNIAIAGGAFYALDLRKYGRSLRPWQTIGFCADLREYDGDLGAMMHLIRTESPGLPIVLMGHSTGGLIATVWAYRHPGTVEGLVLNSAWLELQTMAALRPAMAQVMARIGRADPSWAMPRSTGPDYYADSLVKGWQGLNLPMPAEVAAHPDDPSVSGWTYAREWKRPGSYPVPARWLHAVMMGHALVEKRIRLSCPVLSMCSTGSYMEEKLTPAVMSRDVVLDADIIAERSLGLSHQVTVARFPGKHDLLLSDYDIRTQVYATLRRWLRAFIVADD